MSRSAVMRRVALVLAVMMVVLVFPWGGNAALAAVETQPVADPGGSWEIDDFFNTSTDVQKAQFDTQYNSLTHGINSYDNIIFYTDVAGTTKAEAALKCGGSESKITVVDVTTLTTPNTITKDDIITNLQDSTALLFDGSGGPYKFQHIYTAAYHKKILIAGVNGTPTITFVGGTDASGNEQYLGLEIANFEDVVIQNLILDGAGNDIGTAYNRNSAALLCISQCRDVLVDKVTIQNVGTSASNNRGIYIHLCEDIYFDNLKILNQLGTDPAIASIQVRDIYFRNIKIDNGNDYSFSFYSGFYYANQGVGPTGGTGQVTLTRSSENIVFLDDIDVNGSIRLYDLITSNAATVDRQEFHLPQSSRFLVFGYDAASKAYLSLSTDIDDAVVKCEEVRGTGAKAFIYDALYGYAIITDDFGTVEEELLEIKEIAKFIKDNKVLKSDDPMYVKYVYSSKVPSINLSGYNIHFVAVADAAADPSNISGVYAISDNITLGTNSIIYNVDFSQIPWTRQQAFTRTTINNINNFKHCRFYIPSSVVTPTPTPTPTPTATPTPTPTPTQPIVTITPPPSIPAGTPAPTTGWQQGTGTNGPSYTYQDGTLAKGWKKLTPTTGGTEKWYYFDEDGKAISGWLLNGKNSGGVGSPAGSERWYYLNEAAGGTAAKPAYSMAVGWNKVHWKGVDNWYYFKADGVMYTGWFKDGKNADGTDRWYYLKPNRKQDQPMGSMATGWQKVDGVWYYFADSGVMQTGWLKNGNSWYYLKPSGAMVANAWQQVGGKWYWFNSSGAMVTGTQTINGKTYRFDSSGAWIS